MQPTAELVQLSAASAEPLSVGTAKSWLRVDTCEDNDLIGVLCIAVRDYAERFCRRSFKTGDVYQLTMNVFPLAIIDEQIFLANPEAEFWGTALAFPYYSQKRFSIEVPRGPIASINSITYYDATNTLQTLDSSTYSLIQDDDVNPRIFPVFPNWWPLTAIRPDAVIINFTAGAPLPALVQVAMQQLLAYWYANRDTQGVPPIVEKLLWQYRELEF